MKIAESMNLAPVSVSPELSVEASADKLSWEGIVGLARPLSQLPVHTP